MKLEPNSAFNGDMKRIRSSQVRRRVASKIEELEAASSLAEVSGVIRMTGWERHYRIRVGDYRIGIEMDGDVVVLHRVTHRREFYRHFP